MAEDPRVASVRLALGTGLLEMQAQVKAGLRDHVRSQMIAVLQDPLLHAEIVAGGSFLFRTAFSREFGAFFQAHRSGCDTLADTIFRFYDVQWRSRHPQQTATDYLDTVILTSPPTQQEIDDAWEVEIGSSESAMHTFYEGSARSRKGADLFRYMKPQA